MRTLFVLILTICASLCALVIAAIHIGDEIVWERHFRKANIVDSCEYGIGKWNGSFEEAFANTPLTRKEKIPYRGADQVIKTGLGKFLYVVCQFPSETKFQILSTGPLFSKSQVRVDGVLQAEFDDFGEATLNIPPNQVNHHILEIISLGDQSEVVGPATLIPIYRTTDPNVHHAIQRFRLAPYGEHAAFRIGFTVSIILLLAFIWYFGIRYQDLFWLTVLTACATLENFSNYAYFLIPDWGPLLQRAEGLMVLATSSAIVFFLVSFLRFWKASWALQMIVGVALATFSIFVAISPANIFFNFKLQGQLQTYLAAGLILLLSGTLFYRLTSNSHNKLELKRVILVATIALVVGLLLLVQAVVQQQFGMYLSPYVQALIIVTFTCLAVGDLVRRQWEWLKERDKRLNLEKLNGSQRARIEVGSMLAHDLMGHIELLAMLPDDPTRDQILQAQAAGRQALGILENLNFLDSAIKIQPKPTPLHATILSAWQFVSWRNKKKAHNIKFSCIGASGVSLLFDPIGLYRICQNIIGNAFELMPVPGDISVTFERLEYGANVRFYNSGTYIDEVNWSTIFSRFWSSRSSKGLGLSIVKELVQAHGG